MRVSAFRERLVRSANAWKSPFQQQLALAAAHLRMKPRTEDDKHALAGHIRSLQKMLGGRPRQRVRWKKDDQGIEQAGVLERPELERVMRPVALQAAVNLVREGQRVWCDENRRKYAPTWKTTELIAQSIERVRFQLSGAAPDAISAQDADEVRRRARKKSQ
jgi:hypothetical protein